MMLKGLVLAAGCVAGVAVAQVSTAPAPAPRPASVGVSGGGSAMARQDIRAQLMPRRYTTMAAEIGAKVSGIPVGEGGAFRSGQVLVQFDCSLQRAQL